MDRCSKKSSKQKIQPEPVSISVVIIKGGMSSNVGVPYQPVISYYCHHCALSMLIPGSGNYPCDRALAKLTRRKCRRLIPSG